MLADWNSSLSVTRLLTHDFALGIEVFVILRHNTVRPDATLFSNRLAIFIPLEVDVVLVTREVMLRGDLDSTPRFTQWQNGLNQSLAIGTCSDDECRVGILKSTAHNLRCACTAAIDQNDDWNAAR